MTPDHLMTHDCLLGGELSDFAEIHIRKQKATLTELHDEESEVSTDTTKDEITWAEVLCIDDQDEEDQKMELISSM